MLQEVKSGREAEVEQAVKAVSAERDGLQEDLTSLTKRVTDLQAQLQQASQQRTSIGQQLAAAKRDLKVGPSALTRPEQPACFSGLACPCAISRALGSHTNAQLLHVPQQQRFATQLCSDTLIGFRHCA